MYETRIGTPTRNPLDNPSLDSRLRHRIEAIRALIDGNTDVIDIDGGSLDFAMHAKYRELTAVLVTQEDGTQLLTLTTTCRLVPDAKVEFGTRGDRDDDGIEPLLGAIDDLDVEEVSDWVDLDPLARAVIDCQWQPARGEGARNTLTVHAVIVELLQGARDRRHPLVDVADALVDIQDHAYTLGAESAQA